MSACQPLCLLLLLLLLPPPPQILPNPPSLMCSRKDGMIDTQVGIVAPFAYSTVGVASRIFIPLQKNTNKKTPSWQPEWWRCRKQPTPLYLETQTSSCLWNFSSWDASRAAESRGNSLTLPRLNTGRFSPKDSAARGMCRTLSIYLNLNQFATYLICAHDLRNEGAEAGFELGPKGGHE